MGEMRNVYNISVEKPRCRWEDNIKMCVKEIGYEVWNGIKWLREAGSCEHGNEPSSSIKGRANTVMTVCTFGITCCSNAEPSTSTP